MKTEKIIKTKVNKMYIIILMVIHTFRYNSFILGLILIILSYILLFICNSGVLAYAEASLISSEELSYYLRLSANNYKVFEYNNYVLPEEIYPGMCDLDHVVKQRFDSYCLDPKVISDHVSGKNPAYECCQKYGIDWHRSYIIYSRNNDINKPFYPGWEVALLDPRINPDFLPVPQGPRYGFSDWERGGSSYQWLLYTEAKDLVTWYDSGKFYQALEFINSTPNSLITEGSIYEDFLNRVLSGELLSSIEDARKFLGEIEVRGIKVEAPNNIPSNKECPTCK